MGCFNKIDLTNFFNNKLLYKTAPTSESYGIENVYIDRKDFGFNRDCKINEVDFSFNFVGNDNLVCENQVVPIDSEVKAIHLISFCYWGDAEEYIKVIYEDDTIYYASAKFIGWGNKSSVFIPNSNSGVFTIMETISSGRIKHMVYLHHNIIPLNEVNNKKVKEIVLPDNMFAHVFAITIEK